MAAIRLVPEEAAAFAAPWGRAANGTAMQLWEVWENIPWAENEKHKVDGEYPDDYKLLRKEDTVSWIVFFVLFIALILFDNIVLHSKHEEISFGRASLYSVFWLLCAAGFNVYVYFVRGADDAWDWGTGYILEWMLSVDNLFVFRSIFVVFATPEEQKHKPLFWGIVGAVIFRMAFFAVGELLLHYFHWMHFVLGVFLVYTGFKVMVSDEDEASPDDNKLLRTVARYVPYNNKYAPTAKFFARLSPDSPRSSGRGSFRGTDIASQEFSSTEDLEAPPKPPIKATRLLLVVICLEITDIIFAVDSVSAIVAQIPDLFLAYTACVFAMLGLRATFFVVDGLVKLFSLLSYAVGLILIFIGAKLFFKTWIHIPPEIVCVILMSTLALSMIGSVIYDRFRGSAQDDDKLVAIPEETPEDASGRAARS